METHLGSVDYEQAFDNANRSKLFEIMLKTEYPEQLVNFIVSLYHTMEIVSVQILNSNKSRGKVMVYYIIHIFK